VVKQSVSFALHQPLFLGLLTVLFVMAGVVAFRGLPVEAFPDVSDVQVTLITLFPGHAPEEVEKQVTIPVEIAMAGVPHAVRVFSHTQFGLSFVTLTFDDAVDDYFARQRVEERLQDVDLPPTVVPSVAPLSTAIGEIFRYQLTGGGLNPTELRTLEDWVVERAIKTVPGVADVVTMGGFIKQYEVRLNPSRLRAYDVTLQQVLTALSRSNSNAGGSYIEQGEQEYLVRGIGLLRSPDDIGTAVIAERHGTPIRVRDIADVVVGSVPRQGFMSRDAQDEIVNGIVLMRKGENPSEVLAALKEKVALLNTSVLPKGVHLEPYYDRTWLIETTLHTVFRNLLTGALLVSLVLYIFLRRVRAAAIVAAIIPLALLATFIGLRLRGIPANLLSLGAMDFGIVVDGAVIVVENIFRRLGEEQPHDLQTARPVILDAAVQVGRPTLFSMLIIIVAHIPIFTLQRHEGRIFAPMAYTVVSALVGSLIFSLTLVPLLCLWFLRRGVPSEENRLVHFFQRLYRPVLRGALNRPTVVLTGVAAALVAAVAIAPHLGTEFLPELNEGSLWVNVTLPSSVSLTQAAQISRRIVDTLHETPEVRSVIAKVGRPEDGTDPKPISMAEYFVDVKPEAEWRRGLTRKALLDEVEQRLGTIPGIDASLSQPIRDNVLESISQIDGQIVVKIFGDDSTTLQQKATDILKAVSSVAGVDRAFIDRSGEIPQLQVTINREQASRYGLNVSDVEDVIETALGGTIATQIWEGDRRFGVVVRLPESDRQDLAAIRALPVDTASGLRVPLDQVAELAIRGGAMNISRESGSRMKAVSVFIRGRDMGSVVHDMQQRVASAVAIPKGYLVTWGGEFENQQRAMARLAVIVPISLLLIFVLLFDAFQSVRTALVILGNIPLAAVGGIVALYVTGIPLSVSAAIGFIALFGQAVLNGVVMVSDIRERQKAGAPVREAIETGALLRLRTVLMTALLAMLGLLPMALSREIGAEVQRPLAVVVIGGLFSATVLTLVVLPVLYQLIDSRRAADDWNDDGPRVPSGPEPTIALE
jgi:cobalt-zinc-cadmium resistance protein CzcA